MRTLLSPIVFVIHLALQLSNLALWGGLIIVFGLIKLIAPEKIERRFINSIRSGDPRKFKRGIDKIVEARKSDDTK